MSANQAFFAIATMARVLGVSTAGYYAWRSRLPSARAIADDALLRRVRTIHAVSRPPSPHCMIAEITSDLD
jgi:putative transposase